MIAFRVRIASLPETTPLLNLYAWLATPSSFCKSRVKAGRLHKTPLSFQVATAFSICSFTEWELKNPK